MNRRSIALGALALAAISAGCDGDGERGDRGACYYAALGMCLELEYVNGDAESLADDERFCVEGGDQWMSSCPARDRVGTCSLAVLDLRIHQALYPGGACSADVAEAQCLRIGGTFAAGPGTCSAEAPVRFSCHAPSLDEGCVDFSGSAAPERVAVLSSTCAETGGTITEERCPTASLAGTCEVVQGRLTLSLRSYEPLADQVDEDRCVMAAGGTWVPAP